jgi:AraC-like DNA-binding protein
MSVPSSFAFHNTEELPFMTLHAIGWERIHSADYSYNGEKRWENGHVIFQYTLSGEGRIEIDGSLHNLPKGSAFLVKTPSFHRYYYDPATEDPWEFIWFNVKGADAQMFWDRLITAKDGHVVTLHSDSLPIKLYWTMYERIANDELRDASTLSAIVYEWVLAMLRTENKQESAADRLNPLIKKAKLFMKNNLAHQLSLEEIADHVGVSKYYLCRLFHKHDEFPPLEYVRRRRIEIAATELHNSDKPINEIAQHLGFDNASYFGKSFKHYMGMSPREYRAKKLDYPFKNIYIK